MTVIKFTPGTKLETYVFTWDGHLLHEITLPSMPSNERQRIKDDVAREWYCVKPHQIGMKQKEPRI